MSWVAVGVGVGSLAVGMYTSSQGNQAAAGAAQGAADAQANTAAQMRLDVLQQSSNNTDVANRLAGATPEELNALGRSYASATANLDREERLIASIDPTLMEASQQALKLLRGETADINKPMTDMRNSQRQRLVSSLRAQYGPGAESTSIGQHALQQFDMETSSMFAQNQQTALGQAFGIATTDLGARTQRGISGLQQVGQGYSALQERRLNTAVNQGNATLGALSGTSQQMIQSAGAPFVGAALNGQAQAQLGNQISNTGMQLGTAYLMRGGGGYSQPQPQGSPVGNQMGQSMTTDQLRY